MRRIWGRVRAVLMRDILSGRERIQSGEVHLGDTVPAWRLSRVRDLTAFLLALRDLVPEDAILLLEDGAHDAELREFFRERAVPSQSPVPKGTFGRTEDAHLPATHPNLTDLAEISERHAEPEIAIHVHVYKGDDILLQWHDALDDPMYVSKGIPEDKVKAFAAALAVDYREQVPDGS